MQSKIDHKPTTTAGEVTQATLGIAPYLAGGEASTLRKGAGALISGGGTVAGGEAAKEAGFGEQGQQVGRIIGGAPGMVYGGTSGHEALREPVAEVLGKDPKDVTPTEIDQTIAKSFSKSAPAAADFHTVAQAMGVDVDALHNIYKETGIPPDRVFMDAKDNPSISQEISEGKIPEAYDHLRDTRPPIPDDIQKIMDNYKSEPTKEYSEEGASTSNNPFSKIFNPTGMSESARDMATALRQGRGPENRDIAVIQNALKEHAKMFVKMSDDERLKWIHEFEQRDQGVKISDPKLQEAADKISDIYSQIGEKIQQAFPDVRLRQSYFTHEYTNEKAAAKFFSDWVAKQGSERSLKARAFPTLAEAMKPVEEGGGGLIPKTTNPIETVMRYATNMGKLLAAHESVELAREMGIADYFKPGEEPEGWVPLEGNLAEEKAVPENSNSGFAIKTGKTLYAPEDAARVYNHDISEGFTGPAGDIFEGINRVNNFGNQLKLAISAYHFTLTTLSSAAQDIGRALTSGSALERAGNVAQAFTPGINTLKGQRYMEASLGLRELSPELQHAIDLAWENNVVNLRQQDYWKAGPAKDYIDVFKTGSFGEEAKIAGQTIKDQPFVGPVKVLANEVGRVMNTVSHPLMDTYIPRIKFAAIIDNIHAWVKDHPDSTPEETSRAVQDIGNNADNAFGEMMRDNLFWHKITQQSLQTAFLSYSWIAGAARILKGVPDIGKAIMGKQELTADAKYLMGYAALYSTLNGVMTYLNTGQAPDDYRDFLAYRTGGKGPHGEDERAFIPGHIPQYWRYLHDGIEELGNEVSPTLKMVKHLITNSDWRDLPISNKNNGWFSEQHWDDYAADILQEGEPIGLATFLQGKKKGSQLSAFEMGLGIRQAPRFVSDPEGYEAMMKKVNDRKWKEKVRADKKWKAQFENSEESP